jgi:hypothetical protein
VSDEAETPGAGGTRPALAILLVVFSLLVGLGVSEICYRLLRRVVCTGAPNVNVFRTDPDYGWTHRPNSGGWYSGCYGRQFEWRAQTRINALGLRDRERTYEKPPGTTRVLLLGDSITEAVQVPLEQTFATLLETNLRGGRAPVEVINTGTSVYGTDNEVAFFRSEGVRYAPDVVVLVFNVSNDILENSRVLNTRLYALAGGTVMAKRYFHLDAEGKLEREASQFQAEQTRSPWQRIQDHVYLLRALMRLLVPEDPAKMASAVAQAAPLNHEKVMNTTPDPEWAEAWRLTEALIRALRKDVEDAGAELAVAVMPSREAVLAASYGALAGPSHDPTYPVDRITRFLEREGIRHVSLLPPLRGNAERTAVNGFFAWDVHLNAAGHAVVADALTPFVADLVRGRAR